MVDKKLYGFIHNWSWEVYNLKFLSLSSNSSAFSLEPSADLFVSPAPVAPLEPESGFVLCFV